VLLSGLLHHLADSEALELLRMCGAGSSVHRIATADTVYIPGRRFSNLLAALDRGRHVRDVDGYVRLAGEANIEIVQRKIVRSHPTSGRALYLIMALSPRVTCSDAVI
jgi:hypothetical protein